MIPYFNTEEFEFYANITRKLFNYMNNRINRINRNCELNIDIYDLINHTYGNIRYPNKITIYVGTIISDWSDDYYEYVDKVDYIGTCIALAVAHELHHAAHNVSMLKYTRDENYMAAMENDVNNAAFDYVSTHKQELSEAGGFNIIISKLDVPSATHTGNYSFASTKQFYLQTLENVVIRNSDLYKEIEKFIIHPEISNVIIRFNNESSIQIRENYKFIRRNASVFSHLVYKYTGMYNEYTVFANSIISREVDYGPVTCLVDFIITNQRIFPFITKE